MPPIKRINREVVVKSLLKGTCKVVFRKVTDGRFRAMYCTLDRKSLPNNTGRYIKNIMMPSSEEDLDLVPVYDIIKRDWRSFRLQNVEYFYDTKELIQRKEIEDEDRVPSKDEMVRELLVDSEKILLILKKNYDLAEAASEHGLSNFLAERMDAHKKHAWFLRASMKGGQ
jgi:hypothetical protein